MLNFFQLIILLPVFWAGWLTGFFGRAFLRGYYGGFYSIELSERDKVIDELQAEIDRMEAETENND